jgi:tetratricopeptide (TPR) repeat protein
MSGGTTPLRGSERASLRLGTRFFERGLVEPAFEQLERVVRARPEFADVHYMLGMLHERRGELEAAIACLSEALRLNPRYAEARLALTTVYEQRGDYARSEEIAGSAPSQHTGQLDPTTDAKLANLQAALGDAYREVGELSDAVEAYRKALARRPDFLDVRYRLALALREAGLASQAIRELERALRRNPEWTQARVQLGLTYYSLGKWSRARTLWEQCLADEPGRADIQMYLSLQDGNQAPEDANE